MRRCTDVSEDADDYRGRDAVDADDDRGREALGTNWQLASNRILVFREKKKNECESKG